MHGPDTITKKDMKHLAEAIEEYVNMLEHVMVIPEDIKKDHERQIDEGLRRSKKLIKKLEKGDMSVFKDEDEWEDLFEN